MAKKRLLMRKILLKIAEYYATLDNPIFKKFSSKLYLKLENLTEKLVQKISNEHNSTEIIDIALR